MPSLAQEGRIDSNSLFNVCRTAIGGVVPEGTPKPSFASVDDFKQALLNAKFVVYADPARGGAAGVHIGRQIVSLGLADQLKAKTRVAAGGDITEVTLALGEGALGMTQVSRDRPEKRVRCWSAYFPMSCRTTQCSWQVRRNTLRRLPPRSKHIYGPHACERLSKPRGCSPEPDTPRVVALPSGGTSKTKDKSSNHWSGRTIRIARPSRQTLRCLVLRGVTFKERKRKTKRQARANFIYWVATRERVPYRDVEAEIVAHAVDQTDQA